MEKRTIQLPTVDNHNRRIYWEAISVPLREQKGEVSGTIEINRDVTERKYQEEALRKLVRLEKITSYFSRRFFNLESADYDAELNNALKVVGTFVGADRSYIFRFSPDLSRMSNTHEWCANGIERQIEQLQNMPMSDFPWLLEKMKMLEVVRVPDVTDLPEEAQQEKRTFQELKLRSILLVPFGHKHSVSGFFGFDAVRDTKAWEIEDASLLRTMGDIIVNATERNLSQQALRESEQKYRNLIERANDGIAIIQDGKFVFVNSRLAEMTGYPIEEATGKLFTQFIAPEEIERIADSYRRRMAGEDLPPIHETVVIGNDGKRRFVELNSGFIIYEGRPADLVFVRDITERKILQIRLTQAQKLEAIGQLAAGIAHEINTPTQYVGDNISFLVDAFGDLKTLIDKDLELFRSFKQGIEPDALVEEAEQARKTADLDYLLEELPKALQQSLGGVEQVAKIVRAMKDFSHPGQDEKTATDLNRAIESTITVASNEWKYVAEIDTDFDKNLPLVHCLPNEFNQVILNLITNAAHAIADAVGDGSSGEKGKITISTRREGPWAEIRISDTGTGIPDEIKPRIFDPFFTTKAVGKGTGQGLAISHNIIVDKHGGTITFETETGKGTTLIISIPIGTDGS